MRAELTGSAAALSLQGADGRIVLHLSALLTAQPPAALFTQEPCRFTGLDQVSGVYSVGVTVIEPESTGARAVCGLVFFVCLFVCAQIICSLVRCVIYKLFYIAACVRVCARAL